MSDDASPQLAPLDPALCLGADEVVESTHAEVVALAGRLRAEAPADAMFAERAFTWVRDEVRHSYDVGNPQVTLTASEVLEHRVGLCYAKCHLLAALLRAEGIPAALCYQRLGHGDDHVLHGLVAIHLGGRWHRQDPRGNRADVDAQFSLAAEQLAFPVDPSLGEIDYPLLWAEPASVVVDVLRQTDDILSIYDAGLPGGL